MSIFKTLTNRILCPYYFSFQDASHLTLENTIDELRTSIATANSDLTLEYVSILNIKGSQQVCMHFFSFFISLFIGQFEI